MDDLTKAITDLKANPDWVGNRTSWTRLKDALDQITDQYSLETLEPLVTSHLDLPKAMTEVSKLFSWKWWRSASMTGDLDNDRLSIVVAYLRLVKLFHSRQPQSTLEKASNQWVKNLLETMAAQTSFDEERDQALALAMIKADFAPDHWLTGVAEPTFKKALEDAQKATNSAVWGLAAHELRKLLVWACCVSKLDSCRQEMQVIIESLRPAEDVLSDDCLVLYRQLRSSMTARRD